MNVNVDIPEVFHILFQPFRYKVFYGGRGSGKSQNFARVLIVKSLEKKIRILCTREIMKSLRDSVHRLIVDEISKLGLSEYFDVTQNEIRCIPTDSIFIFAGLASNSVDSLKSMSGIDICWIEEGQSVSARSFEILIPSIRNENSEIWISMNPELDTDPAYVKFIKDAHLLPDAYVKKVGYADNPYFPEVLRQEMEAMKATDLDAYSWIWLGNCKNHSDASVFAKKVVSYEFEPDIHLWSPFYGADWGFSTDPTAFVKSWVYERTLYVEYESVNVGLEIDMSPAMFDTIPGSRIHICRADCARPETISYMKRNGFPRMIAAKKWKGSVEDGIDFMRSFDQIVVHPRCVHTLEEMKLYSYKVDKLSGDILPELIDKYNHTIDALRYSLEPLILGYKKKVEDRPAPIQLDSLGRPIVVKSGESLERYRNPHAWMS